MLKDDHKNISEIKKANSNRFTLSDLDEDNAISTEETSDIKKIFDTAKRGDKNSFKTAYENYFNPLYRYVYLRIGNKAESDDLIQDILIKAYNSISDSILAAESIEVYLFSIAKKAVIDWKRKRRNTVSSDGNIGNRFDSWFNSEDTSQGGEEFENIHKSIRELPDEEQDVVIFKLIQELSIEEIARLIEKTEAEAYHLLSKGICSIRNNLKEQYDE